MFLFSHKQEQFHVHRVSFQAAQGERLVWVPSWIHYKLPPDVCSFSFLAATAALVCEMVLLLE